MGPARREMGASLEPQKVPSALFSAIDRYVLRAILTPLFGTLMVAVLLLVLEQMLRLLDFILRENGPIGAVWRMLVYLLPEYFSLALPIGLMLGVIAAYRRLSLASELDALIAGGVSLTRTLRPALFLGAASSIAIFFLVGFVQPYSHYGYSQLAFDVRSGALGRTIGYGQFVRVSEDVTLRISGAFDDGALTDLFLEQCFQDNTCAAVTAARGEFYATENANEIRLRLQDGRQFAEPQGGAPGVLSFVQQDMTLALPEIAAFRERGGDKKEATFAELIRILNAPQTAASAEDYDAYRASFHWRILYSLVGFIVPLIGAPLGIANKRRDTGVGFAIGIGAIVVYIELLEAMERRVAAAEASPWLLMWPIFAAYATGSLWWFREVAERPGLRPLEPIETALSGAKSAVIGAFRVAAGVRL